MQIQTRNISAAQARMYNSWNQLLCTSTILIFLKIQMHCKHIAYTDVETQALGMSSEVYNTAMGVEHIAMTCLSKSAVLSTLSVTGCKTPTYLLTFPPL